MSRRGLEVLCDSIQRVDQAHSPDQARTPDQDRMVESGCGRVAVR